ncbi:MAG: phosphatidate cytidylyltransferase [Thermodesulfobacteriota bacterium]
MTRIITGLLAAIGWLALLHSRSFSLFWLIVAGIGFLAAREYFTIILRPAEKFLHPSLLALAMLPVIAAWWQSSATVYAVYTLSLAVICCAVVQRAARLTAPFDVLLKAVFGATYVGLFPALVILIMAVPDGAEWLLVLTTITAASDTGAYFTGKALGRHKLCPSISPGKTVEGFVGGLLAGTICSTMILLMVLPDVPLLRFIPVAVALTVTGVVGDLVESLLKRSMGVKDSGTILPGHGGVLDRADSLLLTAPLLFHLLSGNFFG